MQIHDNYKLKLPYRSFNIELIISGLNKFTTKIFNFNYSIFKRFDILIWKINQLYRKTHLQLVQSSWPRSIFFARNNTFPFKIIKSTVLVFHRFCCEFCLVGKPIFTFLFRWGKSIRTLKFCMFLKNNSQFLISDTSIVSNISIGELFEVNSFDFYR